MARALVSEGAGRLRLEIVNHRAHPLLARALGGLPGVALVDRPTDVGFMCREDRLALDPGRTALSVWNWLSGWKQFVVDETSRLRSSVPDLVVTDVSPEPLLVAEKLGVVSVVASNFNWVDQYEPHLRADLVAPLRGAYALASRTHAYALRTALSGLRRIVPAGLVTREVGRSRETIRRALGLGADEPLVHLGFGYSADAAALGTELDPGWLPPRVRLLVSANLAGMAERGPDGGRPPVPVAVIPPDEADAHDFIAACDLVVAKAGYGTVAEAIAAKVPILAVPVEGSVESETIARTVSDLGIGLLCRSEGPGGERIFAEASGMLDEIGRYRDAYRRLPAEYAPGAATRLARALLEGGGKI